MDEETQPIVGGLTLSLLWDLFSKHKHQGLGDQKLSHNDLLDASTNFKIGVGVRSTGDGTGVATINCGFQPGLVIIFAGTDDETPNNPVYWSVGAATAATQNLCFYQCESADDGYLQSHTATDKVIMVSRSGGGLIVADWEEFNSEGFKIDFTTVSYDCVYLYIAFK